MLAAVLLLPAAAQEQAPTIMVARLKGTVEVAHPEETQRLWEPALAGQQLGSGWSLRTGDDSKAQLVFPRDNVVILKENSVLYVDKLESGGGASLEADQGSLLVDLINALAPGSDFELETPTALAVVRGTMFGADNIGDFTVTFYGYRGAVDIYDADQMYPPVKLTAGQAVDVPAGEAPSQPYTPVGADDFLGDAMDTSGFAEREQAVLPAVQQLEQLMRRLEELDQTLASYEDEWQRYERRDQTSRLVFLYAEVLQLQEALDLAAGDYGLIVDNPGEAPEALVQLFGQLAESLPDPQSEDLAKLADEFTAQAEQVEDFFGGEGGPFNIGIALSDVTQLFAELYSRLADMSWDAEPYITDAQDLLDELGGHIEPGNPALGLRWNVFDTDNDGLSDMDEQQLGTDPLVSNEDTGFIELIAPDDGDAVDYPDDEFVTFEFEPLDSDVVEGYDLLIQAGGLQWLRSDVDDMEDVELALLVGGNGAFHDLLMGNDSLMIMWQIIARLDESLVQDRITTSRRVAATSLNVASLERSLTINLPAPSGEATIYLEPAGPVSVDPQEPVRVRGVIEEAENLGSWEITIVYDSSVLRFDNGRRLGLFGNSTLFFGDHMGGVLTVSGSVPRGADAGISGDGEIFELEFLALESGSTTVEIDDATMTDFFDNDVEVEIGDSVDIDVF
jgi:hypothetical protein